MKHSLRNFSRHDVLAAMGLETRRTAADMILPALGLLGVGLVVGAGLGLMFAPKSGAETRERIGNGVSDVARRVKSRISRTQDDALDLGDLDELDPAIPTSTSPRNGAAHRTSTTTATAPKV